MVGGVNITAIVPGLYSPMMNKQSDDGTIVSWTQPDVDTYYFDDTIPYGGIYIDYILTTSTL